VQPQPRRKEVEQRLVEVDTSFRSILVGDKKLATKGGSGVVRPAMDFLPSEELLDELKSCFVGRLSHRLEPDAVQTLLFMEGWRDLKVSPMGEKLVLLQKSKLGELEAAREEKNAWWRATFAKVVPWSPNLVATTKRVWVQLRGTLLHVWYEECFKKVAALFGVFVDFDEDTTSRKQCDVANLLISTKRLGRIDDCVNITVMGAAYQIWVVEGLPVF